MQTQIFSLVIFELYSTENSTVIEGVCEVSLRSLTQQPSRIYVKCDRLQPSIKPVTQNLLPARGNAGQWFSTFYGFVSLLPESGPQIRNKIFCRYFIHSSST